MCSSRHSSSIPSYRPYIQLILHIQVHSGPLHTHYSAIMGRSGHNNAGKAKYTKKKGQKGWKYKHKRGDGDKQHTKSNDKYNDKGLIPNDKLQFKMGGPEQADNFRRLKEIILEEIATWNNFATDMVTSLEDGQYMDLEHLKPELNKTAITDNMSVANKQKKQVYKASI